ncbi:hypothetical protein AB0E77_29365 [Streptomyces sp. NPDC032940]|uniref:hypothetical protein n=1 Tax=Streptomyces sp. NPDC032940 TaxID=3155366 RepID=UPI0033E75635
MSAVRVRMRTAAVALAAAVVGVSSATAHAGAQWTAAELPDTGTAALTGITRVDGDTTWAYGIRVTREGKVQRSAPLLLARDDGRRDWREMPMPPFTQGFDQIDEISAVSQDDAWAVSLYDAARGAFRTQHWDGTAWRVIDAPAPEGVPLAGGGLLDVSARSADDVWAVGWVQVVDSETPTPDKPGGTTQESHNEALVQHWDGDAWRIVPVPGAASLSVESVAAVGADDVWVSGYTEEDQPVTLHHDGGIWTRVPVPYDGVNGELVDLEARGPGDIWAAGRKLNDDEDTGHALVAHWNGHAWRQVPVPAAAGRVNDLTLTPGGVAVAGERPDGGAYGMRLLEGRWSSLRLPSGEPVGSRYLSGLAWTARGLAVTGHDESETGLPSPVLLTDGR